LLKKNFFIMIAFNNWGDGFMGKTMDELNELTVCIISSINMVIFYLKTQLNNGNLFVLIVHGPKRIFYNISNYAIWKSLINPNTTQIITSSKSIFRTIQKFIFIWGHVYFTCDCIDYTSRAFL
jgi:hypothetical protein